MLPWRWMTWIVLLLVVVGGLTACSGARNPTAPDSPLAIHTLNVTTAVSGRTVQLRAEVEGTPTAWLWTFNGAATIESSTEPEPTIEIGPPGDYFIDLTIRDATGTEVSARLPLHIDATLPLPRIIGVTPIGRLGVPGTPVTFAAVTEGEVDGWEWNFGGATRELTSTAAMPEQVLGPVGQYTASVLAFNAAGASEQFAFAIEVTEDLVNPQILGITPGGIAGRTDDQATFMVLTNFVPTTVSWDFGAGATPQLTTTPAPQVRLKESGIYAGSVKATTSMDVEVELGFEYEVQPKLLAILGVVGEGRVVTVENEVISWNALVEGEPTIWEWTFDGGTHRPTWNVKNPLMLMGPVGMYTGHLTVRNETESVTHDFEFGVGPRHAPIVTGISPSGAVGLEGESVTFEAEASGYIEEYKWTLSWQQAPVFTPGPLLEIPLPVPGHHSVALVASNSFGSEPWVSQINVEAQLGSPIITGVTSTPAELSNGMRVQLHPTLTVGDSPEIAFEWQVNASAEVTATSREPFFIVTLPPYSTGEMRMLSGTVRARNTHGASPPFEFAVPVFTWNQVRFEALSSVPSVALNEGQILIAYHPLTTPGTLRFMRSTTALPITAEDWITHDVWSAEATSAPILLVQPEGWLIVKPAREGPTSDTQLWALQSNTLTPTHAGDWARYALPAEVPSLSLAAELDPAGRAFVVVSPASGGPCYGLQATTTVPTSADQWQDHPLPIAMVGRPALLSVPGNGWIVACNSGTGGVTMHVGGYDAPPSEWTSYPLNPGVPEALLRLIDGVPYLAYGTSSPVIARGTSPLPQTSADWARTSLFSLGSLRLGSHAITDLARVHGQWMATSVGSWYDEYDQILWASAGLVVGPIDADFTSGFWGEIDPGLMHSPIGGARILPLGTGVAVVSWGLPHSIWGNSSSLAVSFSQRE